MTPATRLYLMGSDAAFILAKYMPEDPDAFMQRVEEEAADLQVHDSCGCVFTDLGVPVPEEARKAIEGAKR